MKAKIAFMSSYGRAGIALRAEQAPNKDGGSFYLVYLRRYLISGDPYGYRTAVGLVKYVDGVETALYSSDMEFDQANQYFAGKEFELKVVVDGDLIEAFIDGGSYALISTSDSELTSGTIGLLTEDVAVRFNSLGFKALP